MCGIVAYIGPKNAINVLINGLKRLEYRGYDSAGVSLFENGELRTIKKTGKVIELTKLLKAEEFHSNLGIAHTRWATHGEPNDINAHPHSDNSGRISLVHNGIIENYAALKKMLNEKGYSFVSETDSEVLTVLVQYFFDKKQNLSEAVRLALSEVDGTFGIAVISSNEPDKLIAARRGSPMVCGIGDSEYIVASDSSAIIQYTRQVIYLADNEMAIITRNGIETKTIYNESTTNEVFEVDFDLSQIEKGGFDHFMLKEIFEQSQTIKDAFRGRLLAEKGDVKLGGLAPVADMIENAKRIIITACGTSYHSGLVGEYLIENLCQIPVEVEYASEFRYRNPVLFPDDLVIAISQSGETADTLAAIHLAKQKSATVIGIVNVVGSSIARDTDAGVYVHAGPEIGVASTKAFTSQIAVLMLIALYIARKKGLPEKEGKIIAEAMLSLPDKISSILADTDNIKFIAKEYSDAKNFLYLGRGPNFPVALEGALKLKEISYIHAEGYPAAEMKHGPIALIDENMPVVFIATRDDTYEKIMSNIEEVRARHGKLIVIASEGDKEIINKANHVIYIPSVYPLLTPVLSVLPLQLLAYYVAVGLGRDVDQPRNLAKSVTVE